MIPFSEEGLATAAAWGNPGVPFELKPGTIPGQTESVTWLANPCMLSADKNDFPEDVAYEFVKAHIDNMDEIKGLTGSLALYTRGFLPFAWDRDQFHPGALRAYEEAGMLK